MMWREWPRYKPTINNTYTVWKFLVETHEGCDFHVQNGFTPDEGEDSIYSNIYWLDESEEAFKELAESKGYKMPIFGL